MPLIPMARPFYINGEWIESDSLHPIINPWDGQPVASVCLADGSHLEKAVQGSFEAFTSVRRIPPFERGELLQRIAHGIQARRDEFVSVLIAEAGKPRSYAEIEVARARICFEQAAHEICTATGDVLEMQATSPGRDHFGFVRRFPLGVILGITPFNFPLNLVAHKVAPAIAAGTPIVLKPSEVTSASSTKSLPRLSASGRTRRPSASP